MIASRRILDLIVNAMLIVSGICIVLMMLVVVADAAMRGLFNSTFPGAEEYSSNYFMVAVTFLPLAFVHRIRGHVIIELFTTRLSPRGIAGLDAAVGFFCGLGALIFCWATTGKAITMTREGEYAIGSILVTVWPTRWMLVFGIFVLAVALCFQALEDARVAAGLDPPRSADDSALTH
ncbi:MAG: TRAP transporter small permease [Pseudolabrys sp.]|jgi:TRAP-type C4-dicarboxylate transport system permease small subunit